MPTNYSDFDKYQVDAVREAANSIQPNRPCMPMASPSGFNYSIENDDETVQYLQVSEQQNTEVLFVREKVHVWPSKDKCIHGRLCLLKQHCEVFVCWLPYACGQLMEDGTFKPYKSKGKGSATGASIDQDYALLPLPVSQVRWLRPVSPSSRLMMVSPWTWSTSTAPGAASHRLELCLKSGVMQLPLHFPRGTPSLDRFMEVLDKHVSLQRVAHSPGSSGPVTWWVATLPGPLARSLDQLGLEDVLLGGPPHDARGGAVPVTWAPPPPAVPSSAGGGGTDPGASERAALWSAWIVNADTIWDVYGTASATANTSSSSSSSQHQDESGDTAATTAPFNDAARHGGGKADQHHGDEDDDHNGGGSSLSGLAVAPSFTSPSLSDLGRTAWCTLARGLSFLLDQYTATNDFFEADFDDTCGASPAYTPRAGGSARCSTESPRHRFENEDSPAALNQDNQHQHHVKHEGISISGKNDSNPTRTSSVSDVATEDDFELVEMDGDDECVVSGPVTGTRAPPLNQQELAALHQEDGRMTDMCILVSRVWQSGVTPAARRAVWSLLLGLRQPGHTKTQAEAAAADRRARYEQLCGTWHGYLTAPPASRSTRPLWWDSCSRIDKDVGRTDRSHPAFAQDKGPAARALYRMLLSYCTLDEELPYCQGMGDLAAPLLVMLGDESEAFWGFVSLMTRLGPNFHDPHAITHQLAAVKHILKVCDPALHDHLESSGVDHYFFAFRWLLITFKRDCSYDGALRLWELVWCCPTTPYLHVYLCAAVLVHYRAAIMSQVHDLDGMLKYALQLAGLLEPEPLVRVATALHHSVGNAADQHLSALTPSRMPPESGVMSNIMDRVHVLHHRQ